MDTAPSPADAPDPAPPDRARGSSALPDWEATPPRAPLVRWRAAGTAVLVLLAVAVAWWAVMWLTAPAPPAVPPAGTASASSGGSGAAGVSSGTSAGASGGAGSPSGTAASPGPSGAGAASSAGSSAGTGGSASGGSGSSALPAAGGDAPGGAGGGEATAAESAGVQVHVVGEVKRPGVVRLEPGARVTDAIRAAGGPTVVARTERINLAAPLTDGQQVLVPSASTPEQELTAGASGAGAAGSTAASGGAPGSGQGAGSGGNAAGAHPAEGEGTVDLNTADAAALETLPGVGPATAEKIIAHRDGVGPFTGLQDLDAVPGIGPAALERLRDRVSW